MRCRLESMAGGGRGQDRLDLDGIIIMYRTRIWRLLRAKLELVWKLLIRAWGSAEIGVWGTDPCGLGTLGPGLTNYSARSTDFTVGRFQKDNPAVRLVL